MPDVAENTVTKRPIVEYGVATRFQPGNPGRPKGSRNKLGEAFIEALYEDFEKHGVATIEIARRTDPVQYLKVIASIVPKEFIHKVEDYDDLDLAELERQLSSAAIELRAILEADGGEGAKALPAPVQE